MRYLLDAVYLLLAPLMLLAKSRRGLLGRLHSSFSGKLKAPAPQAGAFGLPLNEICVWFHGVSVGEVHLLRHLVAEFRRRHPQIRVVISSTTDTGFAEAFKNFPDLHVIRWPLDFSWAVERALKEIQPNLVVLAEGEWWPNFLLAARRRRIPVVAINARFSPRSQRRYLRFRSLARRWLALISHFAAQTQDYADALRQLGVTSVSVTGSVKYDGLPCDREAPKTQALRHLFGLGAGELVWVAGSTQAPEEELALDAYLRLRERHPKLRLILVPRQRERFDEVAEMLQRRGVEFARRSEFSAQVARGIVLVDTIGDLNAVWGLADIAFVGGSLDGRRGGQNMIEAAAYGSAVLFGPHTWNFRDAVERLLAARAARLVRDGAELEVAVNEMIEDAHERQRLGEMARQLVRNQQGATERTLDAINVFLPRWQSSRRAA